MVISRKEESDRAITFAGRAQEKARWTEENSEHWGFPWEATLRRCFEHRKYQESAEVFQSEKRRNNLCQVLYRFVQLEGISILKMMLPKVSISQCVLFLSTVTYNEKVGRAGTYLLTEQSLCIIVN